MSIVKGWSMLEATEQPDPEIESIEDTKLWLTRIVQQLVDKSVDIADKKTRPFRDLLEELKASASTLHEEWSNIKASFKRVFFVY